MRLNPGDWNLHTAHGRLTISMWWFFIQAASRELSTGVRTRKAAFVGDKVNLMERRCDAIQFVIECGCDVKLFQFALESTQSMGRVN